MKLKLQNALIVPSINLLQKVELKGKSSRARTKLIKLLASSMKDLNESEIALADENAQLDENGEIVRTDKGMAVIDPAKVDTYRKQHNELLQETAEVEGATYAEHLDDCQSFLIDLDMELSGEDAEAYDALLDAIEEEKDGNK